MTDAVLFDWDGTLLDSREALLGAWHASTEEVVGRRYPATADEEDLVFTLSGAVLFPRVAGGPDGAAKLAAAFQRAYQRTSAHIRAFPGVLTLLAELRDSGVATGVVTSKSRIRYTLDARRIHIERLVDVVVCQEDTEAHKPDPEPVLHALRALGVEPSRAVMAGDTPVDLEAGLAAGTKVVGVTWGAGSPAALRAAGATTLARDAGQLAQVILRCAREMERIAT